MNLFTKQNRLTGIGSKHGYQRGRGRNTLGVWDEHTHTAIYNINNKGLLYSTGNYIQYLIKSYHGKKSEKESLDYTPETNTLYITILQLKRKKEK